MNNLEQPKNDTFTEGEMKKLKKYAGRITLEEKMDELAIKASMQNAGFSIERWNAQFKPDTLRENPSNTEMRFAATYYINLENIIQENIKLIERGMRSSEFSDEEKKKLQEALKSEKGKFRQKKEEAVECVKQAMPELRTHNTREIEALKSILNPEDLKGLSLKDLRAQKERWDMHYEKRTPLIGFEYRILSFLILERKAPENAQKTLDELREAAITLGTARKKLDALIKEQSKKEEEEEQSSGVQKASDALEAM